MLSYGEQRAGAGARRQAEAGAPAPSKVNWDLLERRIASSEKAYQRQIIRKKIDELVQYYEQCRQARDLPSIPGAVIISCDEKLTFQPADGDSRVGILKVPEREGILRAIDGQHRLLALHADIDRFGGEDFTRAGDHLRSPARRSRRPDVRHDQREAHAAERVAPGQPVGPAALSRRERSRPAHDVVRALNDREDSPLYDEIKLLGVGRGRVAQAPLAQELKKLFAADGVSAGPHGRATIHEEAKKFFVNYFKQIALVFGGAWNGRKYSIKLGVGAARVRPRRARRHPAARSGARRPRRLPRHRPRHRAVGPPHRRSAVRNRRRVEATRHDGRLAGEGAAARAAVSRRGRGLSCLALNSRPFAGQRPLRQA